MVKRALTDLWIFRNMADDVSSKYKGLKGLTDYTLHLVHRFQATIKLENADLCFEFTDECVRLWQKQNRACIFNSQNWEEIWHNISQSIRKEEEWKWSVGAFTMALNEFIRYYF